FTYLAEQPDQRAITLRRKQLQLISARLLHYFNHTTRVRRSVTEQGRERSIQKLIGRTDQ
ncbi:hypothetical protein, partial [Serratia oryzae]|uniref:hypothetical protein n=1 Tax=Serratia oryzae TaxID=2034155 RepID=UPI001ABF9258